MQSTITTLFILILSWIALVWAVPVPCKPFIGLSCTVPQVSGLEALADERAEVGPTSVLGATLRPTQELSNELAISPSEDSHWRAHVRLELGASAGKQVRKLARSENSIVDDIRLKMKEQYERILERVKDAIENGKGISEKYVDRLKKIREKFEGNTGDIDNEAKGLLDKFTGRAREAYEEFLERLGTGSDD